MSDYITIAETIMTAGKSDETEGSKFKYIGYDRYNLEMRNSGQDLDPNIIDIIEIYSEWHDGLGISTLNTKVDNDDVTHIKIDNSIYSVGTRYSQMGEHQFTYEETYNIELLRERYVTVPDTDDFSLERVDEVVQPSENSLEQSFIDAEDNRFDPAYQSSEYDSLYCFRNYGLLQEYSVTVNVQDSNGNNVQGATVNVSGHGNKTTDSSGNAVYKLDDDTYSYEVSKSNYDGDDGNFTVDGSDKTVYATINEHNQYNLTFKVEDEYGNDVSGATVNVIDEISGTTDTNGEVTFNLYEQSYSYSVMKDGYKTNSGTVDLNSNMTETVILEEAESHDCNITIYLHANESRDPIPEYTYYLEGWMYAFNRDGLIEQVIEVNEEIVSYGEDQYQFSVNINNIPGDYKVQMGLLQLYRMIDGNKFMYEKAFYENYPYIQPWSDGSYFSANENVSCYYVMSIEDDGSIGAGGEEFSTFYVTEAPEDGDLSDEIEGGSEGGAPAGLLGML